MIVHLRHELILNNLTQMILATSSSEQSVKTLRSTCLRRRLRHQAQISQLFVWPTMFQFGKQDKALIDTGLKQFLGKYVHCAIHLQRRQNRNFQKYPWKGHLKEGRGGVSSKTVTFSANKWQIFCKVWSSINSKPCTTFTDCVADVVLQCTMVRMLRHVAQWLLLCETWHQHYHIHATYVSLHIFIHVAHNKYAWTNSSKANHQCKCSFLHICTDADKSLTTTILNCRPA